MNSRNLREPPAFLSRSTQCVGGMSETPSVEARWVLKKEWQADGRKKQPRLCWSGCLAIAIIWNNGQRLTPYFPLSSEEKVASACRRSGIRRIVNPATALIILNFLAMPPRLAEWSCRNGAYQGNGSTAHSRTGLCPKYCPFSYFKPFTFRA